MRIAIISDIHGNLEALTAACSFIDANRIDRVICLGDIVGYGPDPVECLAMVRDRTNLIILGNHDEAIFDASRVREFNSVARSALEWTIPEMGEGGKDFFRSLPYTLSIDNMLYVHSTPLHPAKWDYIFSSFEARLYGQAFNERVCFVGHSHIPGVYAMNPRVRDYDPSGRFIINVGSIGQPRDGDPRLCFGLLDTMVGMYECIRLEYDMQATALKILRKGLPRYLAERILIGR